ncbi:hypothetical protein PV325_010931 [Microctonus aethiopoides]
MWKVEIYRSREIICTAESDRLILQDLNYHQPESLTKPNFNDTTAKNQLAVKDIELVNRLQTIGIMFTEFLSARPGLPFFDMNRQNPHLHLWHLGFDSFVNSVIIKIFNTESSLNYSSKNMVASYDEFQYSVSQAICKAYCYIKDLNPTYYCSIGAGLLDSAG